MYKQFFHLTRSPFELSPDPSFLFGTPKHNEALASLFYGIRRRKGFIVLTGEVGTGKTLLIRCLLRMLPPTQVTSAYLFNPLLTPTQFLEYIIHDLGLPKHVTRNEITRNEILQELYAYLIDRNRRGLTSVLVVDEAHHLSCEVLEEIRLLTNLETEQKLLQIVLAGQPELDAKLDSPELRQLKQRVAFRCCLDPLSREETFAYMQRRLEVAGLPNGAVLFPPETASAVYRYSRGVPRLVNTICENSLIAAFARQTPSVTVEIVEEIVKDLRLTIVTANQNSPATGMTQQSAVEMLLRLLDSIRSNAAISHSTTVSSRERTI